MSALLITVFILFLVAMLALDVYVFRRERAAGSIPRAVGWSVFWILLALAFNLLVFIIYEYRWFGLGGSIGSRISGSTAALQFLNGFLLEKFLSIDNIFLIAMIFASLRIPLEKQHRVLVWGIMGIVLLRGIMILLGAPLLARFGWLIYVFGAILLLTAIKLLVSDYGGPDAGRSVFVRLFSRFYPVSSEASGSKFFTRAEGRLVATPLFVALLLVGGVDLLFAVDSIPAIYSVTGDGFIVFTSSAFAVLGLHSLYFVLAAVMEKFRYLKISMFFMLIFIGIKTVFLHYRPISPGITFLVIAAVLAIGVISSLFVRRPRAPRRITGDCLDHEYLASLTRGAIARIITLVIGSTAAVSVAVVVVLPFRPLAVISFCGFIILLEIIWAWRLVRHASERAESRECGPSETWPDGNGAQR